MTGYIPTFEQIEELHRKSASSQEAFDLIHTHCVVVATIAQQLVRHQNELYRLAHSPESQSGEDMSPAQSDSQTVVGGAAPHRLLDENVTIIGGLLHDIGTYQVLKADGSHGTPLQFDGPRYILHGILGYEFLLSEGVDESVAQFARNHTGVGLTREAVISQHLPLPPDDYSPKSLEQEVVMVADKYNSKSIPPKFLTVESYARKAGRYGESNKQHWLALVEQYGRPDIPDLARRFGMRIA